MATFHEMTEVSGKEVIRCYIKGAADQLLTRAATLLGADAGQVPADETARERYQAENQRLGEQGLRVISTARKDLEPATFDPGADLLPLVTGLELLTMVGIVDPPRPTAKASIATADLHRRRPVGRGGRRDPQSSAAAGRCPSLTAARFPGADAPYFPG